MYYMIITKKKLMLCCCAIVAAAAVIIGSFSAYAAANRRIPIYCVETEKKQIAISFDAAWGADDTETIISILGEYKVPATFFVVGAWVDKYAAEVKALHDAGHMIQNHSNSHPHMPQLSGAKMADEVTACNDKIAAITGVTPTLFRPPYGDYDNATIESLERLDMFCIQWSVDTVAI